MNPRWVLAVWRFGWEVCYGDLSCEISVGCCSVKFFCRGVLWWCIVWTLCQLVQCEVLVQRCAMLIYRVNPRSVLVVWSFGAEVCYGDLSWEPSVSSCSMKVWCRGVLLWFIVWTLCQLLQCEVLVKRCAMLIYRMNPVWVVAVWSFGAEVCYIDLLC